jgi:hypothetical protein
LPIADWRLPDRRLGIADWRIVDWGLTIGIGTQQSVNQQSAIDNHLSPIDNRQSTIAIRQSPFGNQAIGIRQSAIPPAPAKGRAGGQSTIRNRRSAIDASTDERHGT